MTIKELCDEAYQSIVDTDEDQAFQVLHNGIAGKVDLMVLLTDGYSRGMQQLGEQFSTGEVFLPDLMFAAEIMQNVSGEIEKILVKDGVKEKKKGKVLIATVEGDVHDIGKGICASLIKAKGIDVIDMGRDVAVADIVEMAEETGADIIGLSALLTTTMINQQKVIELLIKKGIRDKYKVMVGGAPVTERWAKKIGADYYTEDASEFAAKVIEILG